MIPWAIPRSQSKWHDNRFSHFCTGDRRVSLYFAMGCPFPQNWPFSSWGSGPHVNHDSSGHSEPTVQTASRIGSPIFTQVIAECPYTSRWDTHFPFKIATSHWGYGPPSNTWFPEPPRVLNPNGISIGSTIFAGLANVTDRQADRPRYSVGNILRM